MTRKRSLGCLVLMLTLVGGICSVLGAAPAERAFGFGGPMAAAFFPDLTGVNAYLSENGLDPFGELLVGAGGSGRGGVIGGMSFGGIGWGVVATSTAEDRSAELVFGGGGSDFGFAIGGDANSVLTVGVVIGGGATVLTLTFADVGPSGARPAGLIVDPIERTLVRALGFVQPYVGLEAQLLSWLGVELRVGYVVPLIGFDFGDLVGIPAPSLNLSGPIVSLSVLFGGIGETDDEVEPPEEAAAMDSGSLVLPEAGHLGVTNRTGDIVISSYPFEPAQTGSLRLVEWVVVRTCRPRELAELRVEVEEGPAGALLRSVGDGRIDYYVKVPAGTDLELENGAGRIEIASHVAEFISIENGAGDVELYMTDAAALLISVGVGSASLIDVNASALTVNLGIGRITVDLPADASAEVSASVGLGDVEISGFPGMVGSERGFLSEAGQAILGSGAAQLKLSVGIGKVEVRPLSP